MDSLSPDHGIEDACFDGIHSYCFKDNQKFMEGWRKVQQAVPDDKLYDSLIKAQVFFYSREVCTVDFARYCTWLAQKHLKVRDLGYLIARIDIERTGKKPGDSDKGVHIKSVKMKTAKISYTPNANSSNIENINASGEGEPNTAVESVNNISIIDSDDTTATLHGFNAEDNKTTEECKSIDNKIEFSNDDNISEVAKQPANFMELIEMIQNGMKLPDTEDLNIEPLNEDPTPCDISRPIKPWEVS